MSLFASFLLLSALSSPDAVVVLLNSPAATSSTRFAEAQRIVLEDAKAGKPLQQFVVGVTTKDPKAAKAYADASRDKIRRLAEERNNPLAWYLLSMEKNDFRMLKRAADGGNIQALNALGSIMIQTAFDHKIDTNRLEKALAQGFNCFRRAAAQRDPNGYINLGTCYLRGFGCEPDFALAHQCFRAAAEAGHPEGMDYVSANFENGHGVERNPELALLWRMKAKAVRGDKAAQEWLKQ